MDNKYCTNCGTQNTGNAKFCTSCGNTFAVSEPVTVEQKVEAPVQKPKKKKGKGGIVALIVILLIIGLIAGGIYLYKKLNFFSDPFTDIDELGRNTITSVEVSEESSLTNALAQDYMNGVINTDKYLSQLAYAIYEPSKLDQKYASLVNDYDNPRELFELFFDKYNELSVETTKYIIKKYTLADVKWDVPEVDKTSNEPSIKYVSDNDGRVNKLDKVILSSKGHFLIYYTNDGVNGVTDEYAKTMAKHLEYTVKKYKSKYDLDFKYTGAVQIFDPVSNARAADLLIKNDISITNLDSALPVYILNTEFEGSNVPAFYAGFSNNIIDVFAALGLNSDELSSVERFQMEGLSSTYTVPYIVMTSDMSDIDSVKLISSHELFHHYQHFICGKNGGYANCPCGKFTIETTANIASLQINDNINTLGTEINKHAAAYARNMESPVNSVFFQGYLSYVFAGNYAEIVPSGTKKLFASLKEEDPFSYLYNQSNGKYKEVILQTAERALTLDYKNKQLLPYENSYSPTYPKNHDIITVNHSSHETMLYSSMDYYYIDLNNTGFYSDNTTVTFQGDSDNLTLQFFIYENGKYKKVYTQSISKEFVIKQSDWKDYDEIVIGIVNTAVDGTNNYTWTSSETSDKKPTITPTSLGLKKAKEKKTVVKSSIECYKIEDEEYFATYSQVYVSFDNKDEVNDMYARATVKFKDYDANSTIYKFAKGVTTGVVFLLKQQYKQQLGSISLKTKDEGERYVITARVKKDYYTAIKNSFNTNLTSREDIFNAIQNEGFTCQYK